MSHDVRGRDQGRSHRPRSYAEPIAVVLLLLAVFAIYAATGVHEARKDRERDAVVMANVDTLAAAVERFVRVGGAYPRALNAAGASVLLPGSEALQNPVTGRWTEPRDGAGTPGCVVYTPVFSLVDDPLEDAPRGCVIQGFGANGVLLKEVVLPRQFRPLIDESKSSLWPIEKLAISGDANAP
ncbi:MAG: hypothetical protein HY341_00280 [Candidatus Kerfeldbacteria bacterium]|nr:hypothetical protein [Candidatus Kerfeldbacteria bacterium]